MHADERNEVDLQAGDIVALLHEVRKQVTHFATLLTLLRLNLWYSQNLISIAIKPKDQGAGKDGRRYWVKWWQKIQHLC